MKKILISMLWLPATIASLLLPACFCFLLGQQNFNIENVSGFSDSKHHWLDITDNDKVITPLKDQQFYKPADVREIANNILLYQQPNGGWPKNYDMLAILTDDQKTSLSQHMDAKHTSFDNGATYTHTEYLAKAYTLTGVNLYRDAVLHGIEYILKAQYDNGGWPQFYPDTSGYRKYITFNDGGMIGIMSVLQHIVDGEPYYSFLDNETKGKVVKAYQDGIACILKCQIKENGKLTAWCQQHDNRTLKPANARTFELASKSAQESAEIVAFLMRVNDPGQEIINAINSAVTWFEKVKINGIRVKTITAEPVVYQFHSSSNDRVVEKDPSAPPIWTRFYELGTDRPLFANRDGQAVYQLADVARERRTGYSWYNYSPAKIINEEYPKWVEKIKAKSSFKPNPVTADKYDFIVAQDGSGNFTTIQAAIDASKAFPYQRVKIFIKKGVYHEKVLIPSCNTYLSLVGENKDSTIITYGDYFNKIARGRNSTFYTATVLVQANDFHAENLTIENSAGPVGQALALAVEANRCSFKNCKLLGNQDTLYVAGENARQLFSECYIEGTTDFIFGEATVFFNKCTIKSKSNSFITAASTPPGVPYGFVLKDCSLLASPGVDKVFLGRPWRKYAKTVYINCNMGGFILPTGWNNWSDSTNEKTAFYAEYKNSGEGAVPGKRASWSRQLSDKEAKKYTIDNVLGGTKATKAQESDWLQRIK